MAARWGWHCDTVDSPLALAAALQGAAFDLLVYDDSLASAAHAAPVPRKVCVRSGLTHGGRAPASDPELLRPLTRSALFHVLYARPEPAPAPAVPQQDDEAGAHALSSGEKALEGLSILLAEDNALNQLVARSMLEAVGAQVHITENGEQALAFLREGATPVDLVLMDVQMPVMDGFAATQHIRAELRLDVPILAMSAGVSLAERAECDAAGMNGFVAKPVDGDDLITTILQFVHVKERN
jgi:CheY-like chemotaxis protein